jgi:hypothetical protein
MLESRISDATLDTFIEHYGSTGQEASVVDTLAVIDAALAPGGTKGTGDEHGD